MVYSTSRCPKCGQIIRRQTNPVHKIGSPFERCRYCGSIYLNSYKEEWITKSPVKITEVRVENDNRLVFLFADEEECVKRWQDRSRAESWTEEMKNAARERQQEGRSHHENR